MGRAFRLLQPESICPAPSSLRGGEADESTRRLKRVRHGDLSRLLFPLSSEGSARKDSGQDHRGLRFADRPARHSYNQHPKRHQPEKIRSPLDPLGARSCCGVRKPETSRLPDPSTLDHAATPFVPSSKLSSRNMRREGRQDDLSLHTLSAPAHVSCSGTLEASLPGERDRSRRLHQAVTTC